MIGKHFIVLKVIVFGERHLLVTLLGRQGYLMSSLCIGGQGSSKKNTGTKLDIGYVIEIDQFEFNKNKLQTSFKEFQIIWSPMKLRDSYKCISVLHLILELSSNVFQEKIIESQDWINIKNDVTSSHEFDVLNKFIKLLEEWNFSNRLEMNAFAGLFLAKLVLIQGVMPRFQICHQCNRALSEEVVGLYDSAYFYCRECKTQSSRSRFFWSFLFWAKVIKQNELINNLIFKNEFLNTSMLKFCIDELLQLLTLKKEKIKSLSVLLD